MYAIAYRVRNALRTRLRATLTTIAVISVVCGAVLAVAAGAVRTASSPQRYVSAFGRGEDATVIQYGGQPRSAEIAGLDGVASIESTTFIFGGIERASSHESLNASTFSGSYRATGQHLVAGRGPSDASEFAASRSFMDAAQALIGDEFVLRTITQEQSDQAGFDVTDPKGPTIRATLVGVFEGPSALDDPTPLVVFPKTLIETNPTIGVALTLSAVGLDPGVDLAGLRTRVNSLPNGESFSVQPAELISEYVRNSVRTQSRGLQILALVGGLAAFVALGQLVSRRVRLSRAERQPLIAVGYTSRQIATESLWCGAVPISVGAVGAAVLAYTVSGLFPVGFAERLEPHRGLRGEWPVLLIGIVLTIAALLVWVGVSVSVTERRRTIGGVSPVVESLAVRIPAWAGTGLRFAYSSRERDRSSARSSLVGLSATSAALIGALIFGSSLGRLVTDPDRYGYNYDLGTGSGGQISNETQNLLANDPDVGALTLLADGAAAAGSDNLPLVGIDQVRGPAFTRVLAGRLPANDREIALGRISAKRLRVHVGDDLALTGEGGRFSFRITGLVVVPPNGSVDGIGTGAVVDLGALRHLAPDTVATNAAVVFKRNANANAAERLTKKIAMHTELPGKANAFVPPAIINLRNVTAIPDVLVGLLMLLAIVTIVHAMITAIRYRDLAILRALGAQRTWLTKAVAAQAFAFVTLPALVGGLLGLLIGRALFRLLADGIGAVNEASAPLFAMALVAAGLLLTANLATLGQRRARLVTSTLLRND